MRASRECWLLLLMAGALACGGRYEKNPTTDGGGSAGSGTGGTGTSTGASGSNAAGSSAAGSSAAGAPASGCTCDPSACAPGYVATPTADGCCTQCTIDLLACSNAQKAYLVLRQQLVSQAQAFPCMTDANCQIFEDNTDCGPSCGVVLPQVSGRGVADPLNAFATSNCNPDCPVGPQAACPPLATPRCIGNRCR